jgi:ElaB/YqjD/DUF883 family membrane-anchored ribosome-binding protein
MKKHTQAIRRDAEHLSGDVRELKDDALELAEHLLEVPRNQFIARVERGKKLCRSLRDKGSKASHTVDQKLHEHSYSVMAVAGGLGALIGFLFARRCNFSRS